MILQIYSEFGTEAYFILKKYEYRFYIPKNRILSHPVIKEFYLKYGEKAKIFFEKHKGKMCRNKNAARGLKKFLEYKMNKELCEVIFGEQIKQIEQVTYDK